MISRVVDISHKKAFLCPLVCSVSTNSAAVVRVFTNHSDSGADMQHCIWWVGVSVHNKSNLFLPIQLSVDYAVVGNSITTKIYSLSL